MSPRTTVGAALATVALVAMSFFWPAREVAQAQPRRPSAGLSPIAATDAVPAGSTARLALQVSLPEGYHVQSNAPREAAFIPTVLAVEAPAGFTVTEIVYPEATDLTQAGQSQPLAVFEREFVIGIVVSVPPSAAPGDAVVRARFRYQACDAQLCYAPATVATEWRLRIVAAGSGVAPQQAQVFDAIAFGRGMKPSDDHTLPAPAAKPDVATAGDGLAALDDFEQRGDSFGGYLSAGDFVQQVRDAEAGVTNRGLLEGRGPLAILLVVLIGGLALNLTPCVLPMIPINLAIIGAGAQAGSRRRGFLLGSAYGGAMAVVYGVLGLIVILTAGTFGTINASPWFNVGIAVLFVVLGLAMFDLLLIDFSRFSTAFQPGTANRGSVALAFTMGAVAALLAGACVAPVVIQVVLFSSNLYAAGTHIALVLPFVLGIGMAIPWPFAGAGMAALPKPGAWMVRVKQAFGVVILATAAYYGHLAYTLFADRWVEASAVTSSVDEKLKEGWHSSLAEGLETARREQKPVLIDLWATWCKNCLTMDKTTFKDASVTSALAGYVKIKVQAEDPDAPDTRAIMQRFKAVGLPTYVILRPKTAVAVR
ncbi:MAG: cytochrome c biogenesis protein CcdA [Vicinamibacterales bacterium]